MLTVAVVLFALSTMISWSYYGMQAWKFLFGKSMVADMTYKILFLAFIVIGASAKLDAVERWPRVLILRMRDVPLIDATAVAALEGLARQCQRNGCRLVMSGLQRQPRTALADFGFLAHNDVVVASNSYVAVEKAKALVAEATAAARLTAQAGARDR